MFKFLLGVLVGAAAVWVYNFFQGSDDISWEQPLSSSAGGTSYNASPTEPVSSTPSGGA